MRSEGAHIGLLLLVLLTTSRVQYAAASSDRTLRELGPEDELPRLKVWVISPPYAGHLSPLVSIASELRSRGHDVTFFAPVQKGNEEISKRQVIEAGIPYRQLGFTPINKTELDEVLAQARRGSNLLAAIQHFQDGDCAAYVELDKLLSENALPHPDVLLVCNVFRPMGIRIEEKHGIPVVVNYNLENHFWRPEWPFPVLGSGLSDRMTFPQRLKNELVSFVNSYLIGPYLVYVTLPKVLKKYNLESRASTSTFGPSGTPSILNSAPGFDFPAPLPPNVIQTGPLNTALRQTFPKPLQEWLDAKPPGSVVLISLGTVNAIDEPLARIIFEGLGATGKDVLWALSDPQQKNLVGLDAPSTFRLEGWIPQRAVLGHRAIAAMVTHCGNNGVQEALANAVPAVGIPFVADQNDVGARLAAAGFPVLELTSLTSGELAEAVLKVTSRDPNGRNTYQEKARRLSRIFKSYGGVAKAADFVEHIAELGSEHLQMAVLSMPWFIQKRYDIGLVLLSLAGLIYMGVTWTFRGLLKLRTSLLGKRDKTD